MTKPKAALLVAMLVLAGCTGLIAAPSQPAQTVAPQAVPQDPVHFAGELRTGLTDAFTLQAGRRVIKGWHDGSDYFVVWLTDSQGERLQRIFGNKGVFDGSYTFIAEAGTYCLEIDSADGEWAMTIE